MLAILSIKGTLFSVILILSAMPAAVNAVILAEEYDAAPKLVSRCILWTTLASFIVLPAMIGFL
ncbi:Auxin Efflux Carrier [Paenibacillus vortex V453]|uniref:Auxin Efflux Carrier n=1 Tax=Paenibacillus vortex V453 TaxID=715225 RepID=A0A2R9SNC7_9BACL|nr:Auxin Efflux Carrier [Paenibacillus vortex V453]